MGNIEAKKEGYEYWDKFIEYLNEDGRLRDRLEKGNVDLDYAYNSFLNDYPAKKLYFLANKFTPLFKKSLPNAYKDAKQDFILKYINKDKKYIFDSQQYTEKYWYIIILNFCKDYRKSQQGEFYGIDHFYDSFHTNQNHFDFDFELEEKMKLLGKDSKNGKLLEWFKSPPSEDELAHYRLSENITLSMNFDWYQKESNQTTGTIKRNYHNLRKKDIWK